MEVCIILKRFTCILLLLFFSTVGKAEDVATLPYYTVYESDAYHNGFEICTAWEGQWHGLPLLDEDTNKLIQSLVSNASIEKRTFCTYGNAYTRWDLLLQKMSVLDMTMQVINGIYYEQSNLLGGESVAFTSEEFSVFMNQIGMLSEDVMPRNLDILYDLVFRTIAGDKDTQMHAAFDRLNEITRDWQATAFVEEKQTRPKVMLPGLYGVYAMVSQASREDLLLLADAMGASFFAAERAGNAAIPVQEEVGQAELVDQTNSAQSTILSITDTLYSLSDTLATLLPEDMPPLIYREVYDYNQKLVSTQIEVTASPIHLYLEWSPVSQGSQVFYIAVSTASEKMTVLCTNENGNVRQERKTRHVTNRSVTEMYLLQNDEEAHLLRTSIQDIENTGNKETVKTQTKWMLDSEALLGTDEIVTLTRQQTDTTNGEGPKYKHISESEWSLSGLQFSGKPIITTTQTTTIKEIALPIIAETDVIHPALLDDKAFEAWLEDLRAYAMQVGLTILGRIPSSNATYLLQIQQSQWN